jgi:hypothetical protein
LEKILILKKKDIIQKLTFKLFKSLSINDFVYKFPKQIVDYDNISLDYEKKTLSNWPADTDYEKSKENITLEEFEKLFHEYFYFKLGIKIK